MSMTDEISPALEALMRPYFGSDRVNSAARLIDDLGITGSDYLDLIADIEKTFAIDLTEFLRGPEPQYVSNGCIGWLIGDRKKPVLRDVSIREIDDYLRANSKKYGASTD